MRTPVVAANWKMFKTPHEGVAYVRELVPLTRQIASVEIVVAPAFTAIHSVADAAHGTSIEVAAQNLHWETEGAFTGEVSAAMLYASGARWVIVGHSERRTLFGETDAVVRLKVAAARQAGLRPIVCIGETQEAREAGQTSHVLDRQIRLGLEGLDGSAVGSLVIAYEPVWAIGTGLTATPAQADEAHAHIRRRLGEWFGADAANRCRVIYGGSVKPANAAALMAEADIDGALVGGASLDVTAFAEIIGAAA